MVVINKYEVMYLDFTQLSMFLTLAKHQQFSIAADIENISQSGFSKQIRALEDEIGSKLFTRTSKGAELTEVGRAFYDFASSSIKAKGDIINRIEDIIGEQNKTISVYVMPVMASFGITELVSDFQRLNPQYKLKIVEKNTRELVSLLNERPISLALAAAYLVDYSKYDQYSLLKDEILAALPENHPLASEDTIDIRQLSDTPLIVMHDSIGLNRIISDGYRQAGFSPKLSFPCSIVSSALSLVREGFGVFLFTTRGFNINNTEGIKLLKLKEKLYGDYVLLVSRQHELSQAEKTFKKFVFDWYNYQE